MDKRVIVYLLLALSIGIIIISAYAVVSGKYFWGGDEAISYLCATGNEENFASLVSHTEQTEIKSSEWQELISIQHPYDFRKIADDLIVSDLHPPLYFWLLHIYILHFGVSIGAGVTLNMILHILSLFVLFGITKKLNYTPVVSAMICLVWAASPAASGVIFYARQYELLGLICLLYALAFLSWKQQPTRINILLITLFASLGFLTHYSFVYLSGGYWVYAMLNVRSIGYRHLVAYTTTFMIAALCLSLLHPHFMDQFMLQQHRTQHFGMSDLFARVGKTALSVCNFFLPVISMLKPILLGLTGKLLLGVVLFASSMLLLFAWLKRSFLKIRLSQLFTGKLNLTFPVFMAIWFLVITAIPYFLFITPFHSMGGQYLVCLYPFMAIIIGELMGESLAKNIICTSVLLTGSIIAMYTFTSKQATLIPLTQQVSAAEHIVCDDSDRRIMGRLIPYLNDRQSIRIQNPIDSTNTGTMKGTLILMSEPKETTRLQPGQSCFSFEDYEEFILTRSY
jgi:hypothetical protein